MAGASLTPGMDGTQVSRFIENLLNTLFAWFVVIAVVAASTTSFVPASIASCAGCEGGSCFVMLVISSTRESMVFRMSVRCCRNDQLAEFFHMRGGGQRRLTWAAMVLTWFCAFNDHCCSLVTLFCITLGSLVFMETSSTRARPGMMSSWERVPH